MTIALKTPIAGQFYNLLAHGETLVVSPTAAKSGTSLDEKPIGAGPFVLDSYTPESKAVFKRNPNYFEKNKIKLAGVELIQASARDPQAPINAMLDGITNVALLQGVAGSEALTSAGIKVETKATDTSAIYAALVQEQAAVRQPEGAPGAQLRGRPRPAQPARVRGTSEPMWADWTKASALFNPKLDGYYKHNVKKAKQLLKEAGARRTSPSTSTPTSRPTRRASARSSRSRWPRPASP